MVLTSTCSQSTYYVLFKVQGALFDWLHGSWFFCCSSLCHLNAMPVHQDGLTCSYFHLSTIWLTDSSWSAARSGSVGSCIAPLAIDMDIEGDKDGKGGGWLLISTILAKHHLPTIDYPRTKPSVSKQSLIERFSCRYKSTFLNDDRRVTECLKAYSI